MIRKPYRHDCAGCIFVAWYGNANMYYCPPTKGTTHEHPNDYGTIIMRFSSKPSDYWSQSVWRGREAHSLDDGGRDEGRCNKDARLVP